MFQRRRTHAVPASESEAEPGRVDRQPEARRCQTSLRGRTPPTLPCVNHGRCRRTRRLSYCGASPCRTVIRWQLATRWDLPVRLRAGGQRRRTPLTEVDDELAGASAPGAGMRLSAFPAATVFVEAMLAQQLKHIGRLSRCVPIECLLGRPGVHVALTSHGRWPRASSAGGVARSERDDRGCARLAYGCGRFRDQCGHDAALQETAPAIGDRLDGVGVGSI